MIKRLKPNDRMSQIVLHKDMVYLSGQTAGAPYADIAAQTRTCLARIADLLAEVGTDPDHIVSTLIHISDMTGFAAMNTVWDNWFEGRPKPARTCVEAKMARPEVLVELTVVAVLPDG